MDNRFRSLVGIESNYGEEPYKEYFEAILSNGSLHTKYSSESNNDDVESHGKIFEFDKDSPIMKVGMKIYVTNLGTTLSLVKIICLLSQSLHLKLMVDHMQHSTLQIIIPQPNLDIEFYFLVIIYFVSACNYHDPSKRGKKIATYTQPFVGVGSIKGLTSSEVQMTNFASSSEAISTEGATATGETTTTDWDAVLFFSS
uniref:Uncharacterized protein n=1 Tax=Ananas comosus var. bracteatus TaxID=296719 RepID=A0A6V7PPJ9_ANACO|nr:unnamed protein product [Ananas comosus var. bracteatus]